LKRKLIIVFDYGHPDIVSDDPVTHAAIINNYLMDTLVRMQTQDLPLNIIHWTTGALLGTVEIATEQ